MEVRRHQQKTVTLNGVNNLLFGMRRLATFNNQQKFLPFTQSVCVQTRIYRFLLLIYPSDSHTCSLQIRTFFKTTQHNAIT